MKNFNYDKYPLPLYFFKISNSLKLIRNFFFNRHPNRKKTSNLSCIPFFIIGSGRSGNTLLRRILCQHGKIAIPPESYVLGSVIKKFQYINFLPWQEIVKIVLGEFQSHEEFYTWEISLDKVYKKLFNIEDDERCLAKIIDEIYRHYSKVKFPEAELWGDKTPINTLNLGWINKLYKDAKVINMVRDGRDVVSSYLKMGRYKTVEEACLRWDKSIEMVDKFGNYKPEEEYIDIKYENLVSSPQKEVKKICEFLSIEYEVEMIKSCQEVEKLGDVTDKDHHRNVLGKINTDSIGKWEKNLSEKQKEKTNKLLENNLKKLGYI